MASVKDWRQPCCVAGKLGAQGEGNNTERRTEFVIGSRESDLALWQTRWVQKRLSESFPDCTFTIKTASSLGDEIQDQSLVEVGKGNPGLFTSSLESALLAGKYDLAVHSLKDMPTSLPPGLCLAAISPREAPEDALVVAPQHRGCGGLKGLPMGSVVGTSSLRRAAILRQRHPGLVVRIVRGNLNTRIAKLDGTFRWKEGQEQVREKQ